MNFKQMTEKFQCPGCVGGMDTNCGNYTTADGTNSCRTHVLGTYIMGVGHIALGMPKGFNKPGRAPYSDTDWNTMSTRFWAAGTKPDWDNCNIAVWAMEEDGFLFVRTYMPRINYSCVDIICGGKLSDCPNALNVRDFYDDID